MIDRPASWVNLLSSLFRTRISCEHGFQQQRSNFDRKFVHFLKVMEQRNL